MPQLLARRNVRKHATHSLSATIRAAMTTTSQNATSELFISDDEFARLTEGVPDAFLDVVLEVNERWDWDSLDEAVQRIIEHSMPLEDISPAHVAPQTSVHATPNEDPLAYYAVAMKAAGVAVWYFSLTTGKCRVNRALFDDIYELPKHFSKISIRELVRRGMVIEVWEHWKAIADASSSERQNMKALVFATRFISYTRRAKHLSVNLRLVCDPKTGAPAAIVGVHFDHTATTELEKQRIRAEMLEQQMQSVKRYTDAVMHETRGPTFGIQGSADEISSLVDRLEHDLRQLQKENDTLRAQVESLRPAAADIPATPLSSNQIPKMQETLSTIQELVQCVQECSSHQQSVLDDVLCLSKIENNMLQLQDSEFRLDDVVQSVVRMYSHYKKRTTNSLPQECDASTAAVPLLLEWYTDDESETQCLGPTSAVKNMGTLSLKSDPFYLKQLVCNLVSNAIKHTYKGHVKIKVHLLPSTQDHHLRFKIAIEDTGRGIREQDMHLLFGRFSQIGQGGRDYSSSGLGLVISQQLLRLYDSNATIDVKSTFGVGSEFSFVLELPLASKSMPAQDQDSVTEPVDVSSETSNATRHGPRLVIIVEDNAINQRLMNRFISDMEGVKPMTFGDGAEVVRWFEGLSSREQHAEIALIFMDIVMPLMGGFEATRRIREMERQRGWNEHAVPIIALSASSASSEHKDQAIAAGMTQYCTKPFKKKDIQEIIEKYLSLSPLSCEPEKGITEVQ